MVFDHICGRVASWDSKGTTLGRRPQNRAIKRRGTDPRTGLLNVFRQMACLLLWVARFPSLSGPGPGLCSCVVCGASLGVFARLPVLCFLWATTREPILSSGFDEGDALLNRYLSSPVYVCEIRYHLQGARVIVANTSMAARWYTSTPSSLSSTPCRPCSLIRLCSSRPSCLSSTSWFLLLLSAFSLRIWRSSCALQACMCCSKLLPL